MCAAGAQQIGNARRNRRGGACSAHLSAGGLAPAPTAKGTDNIVMSTMTHKCYVALGSNLHDPIANVRLAIKKISEIANLCLASSLYRTKPWGYLDQPDFINAVIAIETTSSPQQLLAELKAVEKDMGKEKPAERWGPRVIDLDILIFGSLTVTESGLNIPHPRMLDRAFVLTPLAEIDSSYAGALAQLPEELRLEVERL